MALPNGNESGNLSRLLPCTHWLKRYDGGKAGRDGLAAVIVTLMLIPQSLAYAMLAGLPPVTGLYASILPLLVYTVFGTSSTLSVGPVAVVSLMTATVLAPLVEQGTPEYIAAAMLLALLSGLLMILMAILKLGFLTNFLSHPVVSGFITASGILIAVGQLKHLLGIDISGHNVLETLVGLVANLGNVHLPTLAIGLISLMALLIARNYLKGWLIALKITDTLSSQLSRTGPVITLLLAIAAVSLLELSDKGVAVVGSVPRGLPPLTLPTFDLRLIQQLMPAALLISLVGFVESVSVGHTLAAKRRERIDPNQELVGLGGANIAAAISSGFPVTGGFSRSVVNYDAGAATPMAGAFAAVGIALTVLFFTPLFHNLPQAVLAATIIIAVTGLVDLRAIKHTWCYSKADAIAMLTTIAGVLVIGVEAGILLGVTLSLALFLKQTSHPHIAVIGELPGSQHFRNIDRHDVITSQDVLSIRVDESLYFSNARYMEDKIAELVSTYPKINHLVLMCSAVNLVDASALESLYTINDRLSDSRVQFHLSEVKGPVMDRLHKSEFLNHLSGQVFLSHFEALRTLDPETTARAMAMREAGNSQV